jgi:hypothetical protein
VRTVVVGASRRCEPELTDRFGRLASGFSSPCRGASCLGTVRRGVIAILKGDAGAGGHGGPVGSTSRHRISTSMRFWLSR